jgi:hypothetical protein
MLPLCTAMAVAATQWCAPLASAVDDQPYDYHKDGREDVCPQVKGSIPDPLSIPSAARQMWQIRGHCAHGQRCIPVDKQPVMRL